jgi:acylphosphatase
MGAADPERTVRLRVHGRVQGVSFRAWAVSLAAGLGVVGWVRNCSDGSVEALLSGEAVAVEAMIDAVRRGPPPARVTRLEVAPAAPEPSLSGFRQLPNR